MEENTCRDLVLYIPVWKGNVDHNDATPPLISDAAFQRGLILHYDEPFRWYSPALRAQAARVQVARRVGVQSAEEIEHRNWLNGWGDWGTPTVKGPGTDETVTNPHREESRSVDLQRGEDFKTLDWFLPSEVFTAFVPGFGFMSYDTACLVGCQCGLNSDATTVLPVAGT
ncbi:hypothetical protein DFH06DRAFT_1152166 [Mycena polygramma]|nr:hypothetical protein DFH06DRAFT_1154201 [Mycena polygramma]KAJ7603094.1 hypothetical protein DFH06DRAFT_1152166 [Mycena polygramma]